MPLPLRPLDAQLPLLEIDISPFERGNFATTQSGVTPEQYDQRGPPVESLPGRSIRS
jgi:hypothetical protein